jgi:RecA/RadA recombinase
MKVINIFGGPGAGKSTTAAGLFVALKQAGEKVELATEYAKDKVWEKSFGVLDNQLYVFGKQHHRLWRLQAEVDYAVTDSPLAISLYYGKDCGKAFRDLVLEESKRWPSFNFFLERVKPYMKYGRYQDEEQAKQADVDMKDILLNSGIPLYTIEGTENAPQIIISVMKDWGFYVSKD